MIDTAAIPESLRRIPQWIVWKRVTRDGKETKAPVDHRTGKIADAHDSAIWTTFEKAADAAMYSAEGIGFVLTDTDPITGIDLDHCVDDKGQLEDWAWAVVACFDSYAELSPSGRGVRIFIRGKMPATSGHKTNGQGPAGLGCIEIYDRKRFLTVTGNAIRSNSARGVDVHDRQEELSAFCLARMPQTTAGQAEAVEPKPGGLDDDDVIRLARSAKNGDAFAKLFDHAELTDHGGDWSRADMALVNHLAFWTGGDHGQIDRLFRQSALMRDKWDEKRGVSTYGAETISRVVGTTKAVYDPTDAPLERAKRAAAEEAPTHLTDLGNVERLVAAHGAELRYCDQWKEWLAWGGTHWRRSPSGAFQRARLTAFAISGEAATADSDDEIKATLKWALTSEDRKRIEAMVGLGRHDPRLLVDLDALDADPWLLNCRNGTVDLRTGELQPHRRDDLITKLAPVDYDPKAACPLWTSVVGRIMGGDGELTGFLRRALGYAITGSIVEHAIFFLYGTGRNGKSTVLDTVLSILGDYGTTVNADLITANRNDQHPTGLCDLDGRRFVPTVEVEDGKRMAEALVKKLTGGDRVKARRMRQDFYEFKPTHKIFLAANHKPEIKGVDEGIWARIKLIPFSVFIPPDERIKDLDVQLAAEAPGILAWLVRGCLEWQKDGLAEPEAVRSATAGYRVEMDELGDFLGQRCESFLDHPTLRDHAKTKATDLYHAYVTWCKEGGMEALTSRKFGGEMERRGFKLRKSHSQCWRHGITIVAEDKE